MLAIETLGLKKTYNGLFARTRQEALAGVDLAVPTGSAFGLIGLNGAGKTTFIKAILERVGLPDSGDRRIGTLSKGMRQRLGLASALLGEPELLVLDEPTDGVDPLGRVDVRQILIAERRRGATLFLNSHLLSETERVCDRIGILSRGKLVREGTLEQLCRADGHWRLRFALPVDGDALEQLGFSRTEVSGQWQFDGADAGALNAALDRARAGGALLLELSREGSDLEHVLAEAVEARA